MQQLGVLDSGSHFETRIEVDARPPGVMEMTQVIKTVGSYAAGQQEGSASLVGIEQGPGEGGARATIGGRGSVEEKEVGRAIAEVGLACLFLISDCRHADDADMPEPFGSEGTA